MFGEFWSSGDFCVPHSCRICDSRTSVAVRVFLLHCLQRVPLWVCRLTRGSQLRWNSAFAVQSSTQVVVFCVFFSFAVASDSNSDNRRCGPCAPSAPHMLSSRMDQCPRWNMDTPCSVPRTANSVLPGCCPVGRCGGCHFLLVPFFFSFPARTAQVSQPPGGGRHNTFINRGHWFGVVSQ